MTLRESKRPINFAHRSDALRVGSQLQGVCAPVGFWTILRMFAFLPHFFELVKAMMSSLQPSVKRWKIYCNKVTATYLDDRLTG
tara:strand:+ start:273 stop:524 length:252 start_codon:yes stop_codon:yes gene_type:complete